MIITDMDSSTDAARPFMVNIENVGHECPTYGYDYKTSAEKRANPTPALPHGGGSRSAADSNNSCHIAYG